MNDFLYQEKSDGRTLARDDWARILLDKKQKQVAGVQGNKSSSTATQITSVVTNLSDFASSRAQVENAARVKTTINDPKLRNEMQETLEKQTAADSNNVGTSIPFQGSSNNVKSSTSQQLQKSNDSLTSVAQESESEVSNFNVMVIMHFIFN